MTTSQEHQPISEAYVDPGRDGASWDRGLAELERSGTYWMATLRPSGRPHVVPVLAIVHDGHLHVAAGPRTQKARNLTRTPAVTVTTHGETFDIVLEGKARRVTDPAVCFGG